MQRKIAFSVISVGEAAIDAISWIDEGVGVWKVQVFGLGKGRERKGNLDLIVYGFERSIEFVVRAMCFLRQACILSRSMVTLHMFQRTLVLVHLSSSDSVRLRIVLAS